MTYEFSLFFTKNTVNFCVAVIVLFNDMLALSQSG
jgi:hypothetical protein